jgi:hypothetical protein
VLFRGRKRQRKKNNKKVGKVVKIQQKKPQEGVDMICGKSRMSERSRDRQDGEMK